jgi:chemotaxis protein CheD
MSAGSDIAVGMGELAVASGPDGRMTMNLGSCVGVVLVDPEVKVAAALHAMLPEAPAPAAAGEPARYVSTGVALLIRAALKAGADRRRLQAKIIGGANMFPKLARHFVGHLGQRNAEAARLALAAEKIPLVAEDVGGTAGRSIAIDAGSGRVDVRCGGERRRI